MAQVQTSLPILPANTDNSLFYVSMQPKTSGLTHTDYVSPNLTFNPNTNQFNINGVSVSNNIITTSTTAPLNPLVGDIWYDSSTDITFKYNFDGENYYWVDISSSSISTNFIYGYVTTSSNPVGPYSIQYLVVAGGGGGTAIAGGGGGAGGLLTGSTTLNKNTVYTIVIGSGGSGGTYPGTVIGQNGNSSNISQGPTMLVTTTGGGFGGTCAGSNGGSGGGGGIGPNVAGSGKCYPGPLQQGYPGGTGAPNIIGYVAGGGGGAGGAGQNAVYTTYPFPPGSASGGRGGQGVTWTYTGPATFYAGGGGAGGSSSPIPTGPWSAGTGGSSIGGAGSTSPSSGGLGAAATGSGGGGGAYIYTAPSTYTYPSGGAGGGGVVILAVPTPNYPGSAPPAATVSTPPAAPGITVLTYTSSGTYTA